jgi:hypothetical protein
MDNPFTDLLNKIESKVRAHREEQPDELLVVAAVQIKLLKTLYRSMLEFDMKEHFKGVTAENYEDITYKSTKSILDYFQFINILNQFGRILKNKYEITIPKLNRISFFRNKVSEHWEEYTKYGMTGSQFQSGGEAAIPSTSTSYSPDERKNIKSKIDGILQHYKLRLDIDNPEVSNIADLNTEKIYSTLEKIDPELTSRQNGEFVIPDGLVTLLFQFGFPAPIDKVTEYSNEMAAFLEGKLLASGG